MTFTLHTIDTAPTASKDELVHSRHAFGWIPNLHAVLAESPTALKVYKYLHSMAQNTSFNATELTVIWQTINIQNQCHYCIPAHFTIARMLKVDETVLSALKLGTTLSDEKLKVLKDVTHAIHTHNGHLTQEEVSKFQSVGYGNQQMLEIFVILAQKIISNYTNLVAQTPIDEQFQSEGL